MRFIYTGTYGQEKELDLDIIEELRLHLIANNVNRNMTAGELQEIFLSFRKTKDNKGLLIHQMAPMFRYVMGAGQVWGEGSPRNFEDTFK